MNTQPRLSDLNSLFFALRAQGIAVGPHEIAWLQQAFAQQPRLDRERLRDVLACVLVKNPEQRSQFEYLFDTWCPDEYVRKASDPDTLHMDVNHPAPDDKARIARKTQLKTTLMRWFKKIASWRLLAIGVGLALLTAAFYWRVTPAPPEPKLIALNTPTTKLNCAAPIKQPFTEPIGEFYTWVPTRIIAADRTLPMLQLSFAFFAFSLMFWQFSKYQQNASIPRGEAQLLSGPDWLPLPPQMCGHAPVLTAEQTRTVIWGVSRFVSEDKTTRLDVQRTVGATAKAGGIPEIHYESATYAREVWLWQDEMTEHALLEPLVADLTQALEQAGLPVRIGYFSSVPDTVCWREGQVFSPLILEGHRQSALVAILTDGAGLLRAQQSARREEGLARLLRGLAHWPRLTFVGFEQDAATEHLLRGYRLPCIAPQVLSTFLGAESVRVDDVPTVDRRLLGERRLWAAALALAPIPVAPKAADQLRVALGLSLSAWDYDLLAQEPDVIMLGAGLRWAPSKRIELLNWFTQIEAQRDGDVSSASFLGRALKYWLDYCDNIRTQREAAENALQPWRETPAAQRLELDTALLQLWRAPTEATVVLHALFQSALRDEVTIRLAVLAPNDWRSNAVVSLPWSWDSLNTRTQYMLGRMDFALKAQRPFTTMGLLHLPGKLAAALGLTTGVGVAVLATAIWGFAQSVEQSLPHSTQRPELTEDIRWDWKALPNPRKVGSSEYWFTGTLAYPIRGCEAGFPDKSIVIIEAAVGDKNARELAATLLDKGSAGGVLLGQQWRQDLSSLIVQQLSPQEQQQVIYIVRGDATIDVSRLDGVSAIIKTDRLSALTKALDFSGVQSIQEVWGELGEIASSGKVLLRGGPKTWVDANGMEFVQVCGGSFNMGSEDKDGDDDEKPVHPVVMNAFQISKTEVTNAQYRLKVKNHPIDDTSPVVEINWNNATTFCDKLDSKDWDYQLPSEAQWEYATRGGTQSPWSFGDDEKRLAQYAWFNEGFDSNVHPVCQKAPNHWVCMICMAMLGNGLRIVITIINNRQHWFLIL